MKGEEEKEGSLDPEAALSEDRKKRSEAEKCDSINLSQPPSQSTDENKQATGTVRNASKPQPPRLIHSSLLTVPMQVRYGVYGILSSALFMLLYNSAVDLFSHQYVPSTIYAATYLIFIPIQHAMASCMVFGWPDRYIQSLIGNVPIGLTAIALGSYLTAYLDQINFNESMENIILSIGLWKMAANDAREDDGKNEFFTSFFVLIVTSFWSFVLSVFVNAPSDIPEKKEV